MTMLELSKEYRESANLLRERIWILRRKRLQTHDPEKLRRINNRIDELTPMLTQMNELADLTEHYYDRGYWRSEKYTL